MAPTFIMKLSTFMRGKNCQSTLSVCAMWTHIGGLGLHLLVSKALEWESEREREIWPVSESLESTTVLWQEPVQTRDQSRRFKEGETFCPYFCSAASVVVGSFACYLLGLFEHTDHILMEYRDRLKSMQILLSRTQAGPGRTGKQEQEQTSRNHVRTL